MAFEMMFAVLAGSILNRVGGSADWRRRSSFVSRGGFEFDSGGGKSTSGISAGGFSAAGNQLAMGSQRKG
jgi:hypothetical protein